MERMTRRRNTAIKRLRKFARAYASSKLGMLGLFILLFFLVTTLAAPLITPYDPANDRNLASPILPPTWLAQLEGLPYSPYLTVPPHFEFNNPAYINQWAVSTTPPSPGPVSLQYAPGEGYIPATTTNRTAGGALAIIFNRTAVNTTYPNAQATMESHFNWPSGAVPPSTFEIDFNFKAIILGAAGFSLAFYIRNSQGKTFTMYNSSYFWNQTIGNGVFEHYTYAGPAFASNLTTLGFNDYNSGYSFDSRILQVKYWFGNSYTADPAKLFFTAPGDYSFITQVRFFDVNGIAPTSVKLLFDNARLQIYGSTWGLLGLDIYGRDLFSQLIYGARVSLTIGVVASLVALVIGVIVGVTAGYYGRTVDQVLMRVTDILLTIPFLPLVLVLSILLAARSSSTFFNLIIALGLFGWPGIARIIRSQVLSVKELTYVEAARAVGASDTYILNKHIIPNVSPLIWVNLALTVPGVIVTEAAVSFLGLGDPSAISWGTILYNAEAAGNVALWWRFVPPGLCIAAISLAFLLVGYSLDRILNPRLRERQ